MSAPLVVLGPTASGKSDVAMAYARRHAGTEIVVVDSMQVYRGMDIGTAKPFAVDRAAVPHHGLDLADPADDWSVTQHTEVAQAALDSICRRGKRALLVAGTGLYLRALTDPMEVPGQWPELRRALEERGGLEGAPVLHGELQSLDPVAAARMEPTNLRRVVRALEVTLGSGRPFSSFGPGIDQYPPIAFVQVGIQWQRDELTRRIEQRVHTMMDAGFLHEVQTVLAGGMSRTARQALGYRELIDHLEGRCSLDAAVAEIVLRTRQYAVRQERWFRRDPRVRWVCVEHDPVAEVLPVLEEA